MLTCVQVQFRGSSREIEQQVKQHETSTSNKKSNVKSCLKKNTVFLKKSCTVYCFFPVNAE